MHSLILPGGSIFGAVQVGMLQSLAAKGYTPDSIHGTSVGALHTAFIADRLGMGWTFKDACGDLKDFYIEQVTSPNVLLRKRSGIELAYDVLWSKKWDGYLDTIKLYKLMRDNVKEVNVRNCPIPVTVCTVDIRDKFSYHWNQATSDFIDRAYGSTQEPLLMKPHLNQWDGGIRDVAPLKPAIELGTNFITVLAVQPENLVYEESPKLDLLSQINMLTNIITNNTLNADLKLAEARNKDGAYRKILLDIYRPQTKIVGFDITSFTHKDILNMIDLGRSLVV